MESPGWGEWCSPSYSRFRFGPGTEPRATQRLKALQGQLLPTWGPQIFESCLRKSAVWTNHCCLPAANLQQCFRRYMSWVGWCLRESPGWSQEILAGQCRFRFGHLIEGHNKGKMAPACLLCGRRAQQRNTHGYLPSPLPEATQLSFSLVPL